jgi:hypothetical protein
VLVPGPLLGLIWLRRFRGTPLGTGRDAPESLRKDPHVGPSR